MPAGHPGRGIVWPSFYPKVTAENPIELRYDAPQEKMALELAKLGYAETKPKMFWGTWPITRARLPHRPRHLP